ncbi:MAG TPA: molybdopterin-dependent oxidoreductase, partial [Blastocatellia bacterium]|nr:molybdopterin-dependent oxidoreductase [Blastocatellia bacterium]
MKRREFIILTSVGAASAGVLSSCGHPDEKLIPALIPDDEYVPGIDYWKASACGMCPAGCGIIVRTREHKANKIEGNPQHPLNSGTLCARGQAGLQLLYNPDRIKGPLKLAGSRGSGEFSPITWDEAVKTLAAKLRDAKSQRDSIVIATARPRGVTGVAAEALAVACNSKQLVATDLSNEPETIASYRRSYDVDGIPHFDIANATYLLSFGARFLETWHSPVMYSLAYAEFRRSTGRARGKLVQVEPRMSLTGGNADEWLPAATGTEGLVALAIAQVIIRENLATNPPKPGFLNEPLDEFAPEKIAERIDLPAEKVVRIAREFAKSERPLAIGGGPAGNLDAVHYLNRVVGNIGKSGGVITEA